MLLFAAIVLTTMLWCYSFALVNLSWQDLFSYSISVFKDRIVSMNTVAFVFLLPLTLGIICAFAEKIGRMELRIVNAAGGAVGIGVSALLFPVLTGYLYVGAFYVLALLVLGEIASRKIGEQGKFAKAKAYWESTRRFTAVLGIGFFIAGVITILPEQETHLEKMEAELLSGMQGDEGTGEIQDALLLNNIKIQRDLLDGIMDNPNFEALRFNEEDKSVMDYVAYMDAQREYINSDEYVEKMKEAMGQKADSLDLKSLLAERIPYYSHFRDYFFLIYSFGLLSAVFMLGNLVFRPIAVLYALVLRKAL